MNTWLPGRHANPQKAERRYYCTCWATNWCCESIFLGERLYGSRSKGEKRNTAIIPDMEKFNLSKTHFEEPIPALDAKINRLDVGVRGLNMFSMAGLG